MNNRMGVALLSVAGLLISAYLWMFKHGYIGTLACGTGACETVQLSPYSSFLGVDVALIGFLGYVVMLGVSLVSVQPAWLSRPEPSRALLLLAGGRPALRGLPHGPRTLRDPRDLPLVRRLGRHRAADLPAGLPRPPPICPPLT